MAIKENSDPSGDLMWINYKINELIEIKAIILKCILCKPIHKMIKHI